MDRTQWVRWRPRTARGSAQDRWSHLPGKPYALKGACTVWGGTVGNVPRGNALAVYSRDRLHETIREVSDRSEETNGTSLAADFIWLVEQWNLRDHLVGVAQVSSYLPDEDLYRSHSCEERWWESLFSSLHSG